MTDPYPPTMPAFVTHPSWHALPEIPLDPPTTGTNGGAHRAEPDDDDEDVGPSSTALVLICAMLCVTLCVGVVSLFGGAAAGAILAGFVIAVGSFFGWLFRDRWT